ncbi:MAG TPA: pilus assembly protein TadG-related protein [Candidatus Dormibacteraeota bacterium]|nr:pilus assembly protein TadG-related protein [Candidatus Dormibacteraeota bacterium]
MAIPGHPPHLLARAGEGTRHPHQSGQAIVLIALMLTVLIGMVAIAIDGSRAYTVRRDLQAATDAAALAAADKMQQTGSYVTAEQSATSIFGTNLHVYSAPSCTGYGTPGASPWTVTCTFSDGTVLTDIARVMGSQGSRFQLTATKTLQLQFGRVLTNGTSPTLGAGAHGSVNNLLYTPTVAALDGAGCGGTGGNAISINGGGTLNVVGDVVSNGAVSVAAGSLRVAGDIYSRCQSTVAGSVTNACYPSGAGSPCTYPDIIGATRPGNHLADPNFPAPSLLGGSQGLPSSNVVVLPGIYSALPVFNGNRCWFLAGGVYTFQAGAINTGDFVSNELKPPDEPDASNNQVRATNQFWRSSGAQCDGAFDVTKQTGPRDLPTGQWSFVLTSVRTDTYNGVSYSRESAPSMCRFVNLNNHFDDVQILISNVPGATSFNVYAAPPSSNSCSGPFGLATNIPVVGSVTNVNLSPCPNVNGNGCTLGNESASLSSVLDSPFAPNAGAAPGTSGAYPPDSETAPFAAGLPNQNPGRGAVAAGDRANENNCKSVANAYVTCPGPITPGAVELSFPAGGCLTTGNGADTYLFSGYQYNWVSIYEPAANTCSNTLGAMSNSAFIGLVYCPSASISVTSQYVSEARTGGMIANTISFTGSLPAMSFSANYAPVPPASRITS